MPKMTREVTAWLIACVLIHLICGCRPSRSPCTTRICGLPMPGLTPISQQQLRAGPAPQPLRCSRKSLSGKHLPSRCARGWTNITRISGRPATPTGRPRSKVPRASKRSSQMGFAMAVTLNDVDKWDPNLIRDAFNAVRDRADAAADVHMGLGKIPAFLSWDGEAAAAAQGAIDKTRGDLLLHSDHAAI